MSQNTYIDKLPSGIEFEVKRLMGYHQEWLTKGRARGAVTKKQNPNIKGLDDILADRLVRVGSTPIDYAGNKKDALDVVKKMTSADFNYALLVLRFFSCDIYFAERQDEYNSWKERQVSLKNEFLDSKAKGDIDPEEEFEEEEFKSSIEPHYFLFKYTWNSKNDKGENIEKQHDYKIPLVLNDFDIKALPIQFQEYHELTSNRKFQLTLPIAKRLLEWEMLTVELQERFSASLGKEEDLHANSFIEWRNPCLLNKKESGDGYIPQAIKPGRMELLDVEALRKDIFDKEARVNTSLIIDHPEGGENIKIDMMQVASFFFPSGVL